MVAPLEIKDQGQLLLFEHYFLHKVKRGTGKFCYEQLVLRLLGMLKIKTPAA